MLNKEHFMDISWEFMGIYGDLSNMWIYRMNRYIWGRNNMDILWMEEILHQLVDCKHPNTTPQLPTGAGFVPSTVSWGSDQYTGICFQNVDFTMIQRQELVKNSENKSWRMMGKPATMVTCNMI